VSDPHRDDVSEHYCGFGSGPVLPHWPDPVPLVSANGACSSKQRNEYTNLRRWWWRERPTDYRSVLRWYASWWHGGGLRAKWRADC